MVKTFVRWLSLLMCVVVIEQSLVLWSATGHAAFTTHFDSERAEQAKQTTNTADLFGDTGEFAGTDAQQIEAPPNRFMLGFLPSLPPGEMWMVWDVDMVSVLTLAGPTTVIALLTLASMTIDRRKRKRDKPSEETGSK